MRHEPQHLHETSRRARVRRKHSRRLVGALVTVGLLTGMFVQEGASAKRPECRPRRTCTSTTTTSAPTSTSTTSTTQDTTTTTQETTTTAPTTTTTTGTGQELWLADPDTDQDFGDHTLFWKKEVTRGDYSRLSVVNDPTGQHGKVYRAYLTPADIAAGNKRAEFAQALLGDGNTKLKLAQSNTSNIWFSWSSLFGNDVVVNTSHSNDGNYMQLKGDSSCGGPAIGMTIKYGHLTLRSEVYLPGTDGVAWNGPVMGDLLDGQWHDFRLHVNFSKTDTGYLEVWLDGVPQTMTNGQTRIYFPTVCPDDTYIYPKLGVYGMDSTIGDGPQHWIENPRIAAG